MNKLSAGIFYDGYHVFRRLRNDNKLTHHFTYTYLNDLIVSFVERELGAECTLTFKGWYQGIRKSYISGINVNDPKNADLVKSIMWSYHHDHANHFRLIEAGVETVYLPSKPFKDEEASASENQNKEKEKGVDVALSVAVTNKVSTLNLDAVIILTNDTDYIPLIHNIGKKGVKTVAISFDDDGEISSRISGLTSCSTSYNKSFQSKLAF